MELLSIIRNQIPPSSWNDFYEGDEAKMLCIFELVSLDESHSELGEESFLEEKLFI